MILTWKNPKKESGEENIRYFFLTCKISKEIWILISAHLDKERERYSPKRSFKSLFRLPDGDGALLGLEKKDPILTIRADDQGFSPSKV